MIRLEIPRKARSPVAFMLPLLFSYTESKAEFTLNFIPDDGTYASWGNRNNYACDFTYLPDANCGRQTYLREWNGTRMTGSPGDSAIGGSHRDGSAMYQREFSSNGKSYYHVIVGDHTQDSFYMDFIIEASASYTRYDGNWVGSASSGSQEHQEFGIAKPYSNNSSRNGNGTGNPNRVIMRQVIDDGIMRSEFLKDQLDKKPLIKQDITGNGVLMKLSLDMRGKTYLDNAPVTEADWTNTIILEGIAAGSTGDFGSISYTGSNLTAGAYTYMSGSRNGGANGIYTYQQEGGFQPVNFDYSVYCDPDQNINWSGRGACRNGTVVD